MSTEPYGITIFCDDVRQELGNKPSYMGVYTGDLIVQANAPVVLPKLGMGVYLMVPSRIEFSKIELVLTQEKRGETVELTRVQVEGIERPADVATGTYVKMNFNLGVSPFVVDGPSQLRMRAYLDGETEVKAGKLNIRLEPEPKLEQPV